MIKNVRIKDFRGIEDLSLNLKKINILIGANDTGKSSILEAIAIAGTSPTYIDALSNNVLQHVVSWRGKPYAINLSHLVKIGADHAEITIEKENPVTIEIYNGMILPGQRSYDPFSKYLVVTIWNRNLHYKAYVFATHDEIVIDNFTDNGREAKLVMISKYISSEDLLETQIYYLLLQQSTHPNDSEPNHVKSIMTDKILSKQCCHHISFNTIGDSTRHLMFYQLIMNMPVVDVILLDVPEKNMHPSHISQLVKSMIDKSKNNNRQFIITTHSMDLIKDVIEKAQGSGIEDDIQLINMYRDDDNNMIKADIINYAEADEAINETLVDIRYQ